jgi:hypothetical protein
MPLSMNWIKSIIYVFLFVSLHTSAQKVFQPSIYAGLVTSQMSGDALGGWDKFGFVAGGDVHIPYGDKWGLTFGFQFIQKGSRMKADTVDFNTFGYYLTYADVPLCATYSFGKFEANLGLSGGVLLFQRKIANGYDYEIDPPFRAWELAGIGGLEFFLNTHFALELRATTSVLPVRPTPNFANPANFYERGNYNHTLQFMLHYRFNR